MTRPTSGSVGGIGGGPAVRPTRADLTGGPDMMRAARRRWASGVVVVIAPDAAGYRGVTVSAFSHVSLDPPLVAICLGLPGRMAELIGASGGFTVSMLDSQQESLADRFAGRGPLPDASFQGIPHTLAPSGLPILTGALGWLDCRVAATYPGGDHLIVIGEARTIWLAEDSDDPLLAYEGRYRRIEAG